MFIIWGSKNIHGRGKKGEFHCPRCQSPRAYRHRVVRTWFTLYFVPLIPLNKQGEYVQCQSCREAFMPGVLDRDPAS